MVYSIALFHKEICPTISIIFSANYGIKPAIYNKTGEVSQAKPSGDTPEINHLL